MPPFLKKKVAGLPLGVWLIIVGAGVGIGLYLRKRNEENAIEEEGEQPGDIYGSDDYYGTESGDLWDTVPISALPSEDYGQYPLTGGGAPSVPEELALRLQPDVLRIKLIRDKRKRKRKNKKGDDIRGRDEGRPVVSRNRQRQRQRNRQGGRR